MEKIQFSVEHNIGNILTVPNQLEYLANTFFTKDTISGSNNLEVVNTDGFVASGIILLGALVQETAEFVNFSAITPVTITSVATLFNHNRGEIINFVSYNSIIVEFSLSVDGPFTVLGTYSMQPTQESTTVQHAGGTVNTYYRIKFRNSVTAAVSGYSEIVTPSSNDQRSLVSMFDSIRTTMGIDPDDTMITSNFLVECTQDGREYIDNIAHGIHWDWREIFDYPIKLLAGTNYVNLPPDIDFDKTNRSVLAVRYPRANFLTPIDLIYCDKKEWNRLSYQSRGSVLSEEALSGDTTLSLVNNGDFFNTGGVAFIATTGFLQTIDQITYTGINPITNTLTGVTGVNRTIPIGTQVLAFTAITVPYYYTVYEGKIVFDRIIPDSMQGTNIYVDYYGRLQPIIDINTILPERYRSIFKSYLRYRIKLRKDAKTPPSDPDFVAFTAQLTSILNAIYSGQALQILPG